MSHPKEIEKRLVNVSLSDNFDSPVVLENFVRTGKVLLLHASRRRRAVLIRIS